MNVTANPVKLCNAGLRRLPETVIRPTYDRGQLTSGMVHIGVGNFHRAHQAWYLHRLMQTGKAHDWAIVGAGIRPYDARMREALLAQDCMTTLIALDPQGISAEVTGSMIDYLPIEPDNRSMIRQMAAPQTRIVSLTVTEGGYFIDPATGRFDDTHPDIRHDAANPDAPVTVFGAIVAAMKRRRDEGRTPFTAMSCDNLQENGDVLRRAVTGLARLSDPSLAGWMEEKGAFPNSMVDCIVPATGPAEVTVAESLGIRDAVPVTHEVFRQWVIEDIFCNGRPEWEQAGVVFSGNVRAYETMKIRILNAGHQVLANAGEILTVETIADCMAHPLIGPFFRCIQEREIAPTIASIPEMTPEAYIDLIVRRFSNRRIVDSTRRVAYDGASRHTGFVMPIVRDHLSAGTSPSGLALVEALWARMCEGTREDGSIIEPNDPCWDSLQANARAARDNPETWLRQSKFYSDDIRTSEFSNLFAGWLTMIWSEGVEAALSSYLQQQV